MIKPKIWKLVIVGGGLDDLVVVGDERGPALLAGEGRTSPCNFFPRLCFYAEGVTTHP